MQLYKFASHSLHSVKQSLIILDDPLSLHIRVPSIVFLVFLTTSVSFARGSE